MNQIINECKHPEERRYYDWKRTDGFSYGKCGLWIKQEMEVRSNA